MEREATSMMPERKRVRPIPAAYAKAANAANAAAATDASAPGPERTASVGHLYVFVYGTLRAGGSNDITRYHPPPQWIGPAGVAGTLHDFGAWPGLQLMGDRWVVGEVWRIAQCSEPLLDQLEGVREDGSGEYLKRRLPIRVDGQSFECLVYEINSDRLLDQPIIASGDWIAHCASNTARSAAGT